MAEAENSDESSMSSHTNESSGSSNEETPLRGSVGSKNSAQYDDEQPSPEHSSTNRTRKSVKVKTKLSLKSINKNTVQQLNKNSIKANRENRESSSQSTDEFDNQDHQNDHNSTAGRSTAKYDSPSQVKKSKSDKTKPKVSDKRREKTPGDVDPENRPSKSKTKNKTNENKLHHFDSERDKKMENSATRNRGLVDPPPKQQERTNRKGRTSNAAFESLECVTSGSDCDVAEHERKRGRSNREKTGEGSDPNITRHKSSSSNNHANIDNNSKVRSDENRSRNMDKSNNTNFDTKKDDLQRSKGKRTDKSTDKIDDDGYGHDLNKGFKNVPQDAWGTNKKKHSKKSEDHSKKNAVDENKRRCSDRSSSCSSSGTSSSRNHDENTSRRLGAGGRVESHDGSSSRSSSNGSCSSFIDNRSDHGTQNCASNSQGRNIGTSKTTAYNRSKKSHDAKETNSGRASKASCREDRGERPTDRKSTDPHDKKEADSDRASKTSRRDDRGKRPTDRNSKDPHGKKETDCDRASKTSRREDRGERPTDRNSKDPHGKKETDSGCASKTSREDRGERPSDRKSKTSPDKKDTDSNRASETSRREDRSERPSGRSKKPSDHKSKKSHDQDGTDSDCASKTSLREDRSERPSDRSKRPSDHKSKKSHDQEETDSDCASKTSRREDRCKRPSDRKSKTSHDQGETDTDCASKTNRSKRTSDRNSKKSHNGEEVEYKKKTKGDKSRSDRKLYEKKAKRRSDSGGSSRERRRPVSKEKAEDKKSHRNKGKHEHMNKDSKRYHSSNGYNREEIRDRDPADIHKKNEREMYCDRRYSRHYKEENRERKLSASSIESGRYRDSPKGNESNRRKYYNEDSNEREAKYEPPNYNYEWQFENEHGNWITYGQSNSGRPLPGADAVTSDDIEKFYSKHRGTKNPLLIEAKNNKYLLDFIEMSQTNMKTLVRRRIRRVRKSQKPNYQSQNYKDEHHFVDARDYNLTSRNLDRLSGRGPDPKDNQPTRKNDPSTKYEWQFEDDTGNWITYGKTNSSKDRNAGSSITSDDIEYFHARDPSKKTMQIRSGRDQYLLNFEKMTEVNIETLGCRRVRRVAKSSWGLQSLKQFMNWFSSSGSRDTDADKYEWQFQDERGVWITYGQASSNGIAAFSTAASSDDIETYYSNTTDKAPIVISSRTHTYVLDFTRMVQINQETFVERSIRRIKKTSNGSNVNNQRGIGQSGMTAGNGTNAGVNNFPNPSHNPAYVGFGAGNVSHSFNLGDPRVNVGAGQHLNPPPSFPCVWQFQDENGSWITYGRPSSTNQTAGSTTTSDDIEQYISTNPGTTSMIIQSPSNRYVLDIQNMIQINQKTQVKKPVRRVMKQNIQPTPNFQQGF